MSGRLDFEYRFNHNSAQPTDPDTPLRMYFMGDFTGEQSAIEFNTINKICKIDVDNFDEVMAALKPTVELPSGQQLTFTELEDFHPDNLFTGHIFKNLRRLKKELNNASTAEQTAQEIITTFQLDSKVTSQTEKTDTPSASPEAENGDAMFERLLGKKQSSTVSENPPSSKPAGQLDSFLANLLSPHIIKQAKPEHQNLSRFIDTAIEELMKSIIHLPAFQALEAAWRSVRDVIFNEEYNEQNQQFYLVNTSRVTLQEAVNGNVALLSTINQHIKDTDRKTYNVLVGNYQFSASDVDITTLNYLASMAETLNSQMVCGASDALISNSDATLWQEFRQTPQARYATLCYPQLLLRIPYGEQQDEVDSFAFEEFNQPHQHSKLLWGNAAFACARLIIRQYHACVPYNGTITERPAFTYSVEGETKLHPCAELLLSEQQLTQIKQQGVLPFISFRDNNCIRLFGDQVGAKIA